MIEFGATASFGSIALLVGISFFSFVAGQICRKWPDKVKELAETLDGSLLFLPPHAHRALVRMCGIALSAMSLGALLAASLLI